MDGHGKDAEVANACLENCGSMSIMCAEARLDESKHKGLTGFRRVEREGGEGGGIDGQVVHFVERSVPARCESMTA